MKQRLIALALLFGMLVSLCPLYAVGVEREDTENIAAKNYKEDTYLVRYDYNAWPGVSSNSAAKWNRFYPSEGSGNMADPLNPDNMVGYFKAAKSTNATKKFLEATEEFLFGNSLMIPTPESGSFPTAVTLKLSGKEVLKYTFDSAEGHYVWTSFGQTGIYEPNTWMRLICHVIPDSEQGMAAAKMDVYLTGDTLNADGEPLPFLKIGDQSIAYSAGEFNIGITSLEDGTCSVLVDDTVMYLPGDFAPATVTPTKYGDAAGNLDLAGTVTVKLYHELDMSSFDVADIRVYTATEESVPYTSMTIDPAKSNQLVLDFSEHPLSTYTDYYIAFPDSARDLCGKAMMEPVISFATKGEKDSRPAPLPLAEEPAGGYVMPDPYNTGYRCAKEDLVPLSEKYPELSAVDVVITESIARKYGYEFFGFTHTGTIKVTATSPVYIHDFYLDATGHYGLQNSGSARLTFAWAECVGSLSSMCNGSNTTFSHLYVHDVKADHAKGSSGQLYESCYFRDGGTRSPGAHADVIQISGSTDAVTQNIQILGCRFDIPWLAYEHVANACIFMKPENWNGETSQGYANIQISYNWFNGGGYTTYIVTNDVPRERLTPITYSYNTLGVGRKFGLLNVGGWDTDSFDYHDNAQASLLEAGSVVFYDKDGNRLSSVSELSESGRVFVNLANYTDVARTYTLSVELKDADGNTVATFSSSDSVVRNMSSKEYDLESNKEIIIVKDSKGNDVQVTSLKELPFLPSDVPSEVALTDLPADLTGYSLEVRIYDTTGGSEMIRSSVLSDGIAENTLLPKPVYHTVTFKGQDGQVLKTEQVLAGAAATAPTAPRVEGYRFLGWSCDFSAVTSDLTVEARYEPIPVYVPSAEMLAFRGAVATAESATGSLAARRAALLAAAEAYLAVPAAERAEGQAEYEALTDLANSFNALLASANGEAADAGALAGILGLTD